MPKCLLPSECRRRKSSSCEDHALLPSGKLEVLLITRSEHTGLPYRQHVYSTLPQAVDHRFRNMLVCIKFYAIRQAIYVPRACLSTWKGCPRARLRRTPLPRLWTRRSRRDDQSNRPTPRTRRPVQGRARLRSRRRYVLPVRARSQYPGPLCDALLCAACRPQRQVWPLCARPTFSRHYCPSAYRLRLR